MKDCDDQGGIGIMTAIVLIYSALKSDNANLSVVHAFVSAKVQYGLAMLRMDFDIVR